MAQEVVTKSLNRGFAAKWAGKMATHSRTATSSSQTKFISSTAAAANKSSDDDEEDQRKHRKKQSGKKNPIFLDLTLGVAAVAGSFLVGREFSFKENPLLRIESPSVCVAHTETRTTSEVSHDMEGAILFSGSSNRALGQKIADVLGVELGEVRLDRFADGEINLKFCESLRGKDIYIIQPTSPPVNENLVELLLMISTCRRSSAKKITAVVPYYGYARQDRKLSSRVPISAADVSRMIESMGVDRVIAVDLHCGQIQGFFGPRVPVDNLEAQRVGLEFFKDKGLQNPVIVSPDAGGVYRARKFQEGYTVLTGNTNAGLAMLIKQRAAANQIEKMELVGDVSGADVIIVDDMIDTAGTLCEAAKQLRSHGARKVYAFATHGLFSGPAVDRIMNSPLEQVVVSDSITQSKHVAGCSRITQLSIGELLAETIRNVHKKESIHNVFFNANDGAN